MIIRTPDQRLRVFVSSTLGELAQERRAVARAVSALRLTAVMFELGARPQPPRDVYRAYLAQSDVFVGLYWQRYGQVGPGMQVSGLEEEFELSSGLPRLVYVKTPAPDREPRLADLLSRIKQHASYRTFETPAELANLVRDDLAVLLSERFTAASGQAAASAPSTVGAHGPGSLPVSTTALLGRASAIDEVAELIARPEVRLVTLTGPGGVGKTRLAVAVGERLRDRFDAGTVFVPLDTVTEPEMVLAAIGRMTGTELSRTGRPLEALAETFGDGAWLLIVDNLEQVVQVARDLGELLARCPHLEILATSRTALGLRAEREFPVRPLPSAGSGTASVADVTASPAVALFVDRARAVRPGFAVTERNAAAVAEICRRLEGLPLAIELAAARTRLLDPPALLDRLAASLDALGTGAVDLPERQRTLRATVEWSVGLLEDDERSALEVAAVFVDGWTIQAAARVADVAEDRALELCEALARHSLVELDSAGPEPRARMLETIREFVAERLAVRPDAAEVGRRHADHYRALAERADRPLRGAGLPEWLERLQAEAGNLAAAIRWYLAHDPGPLPHLFRVLWLFWIHEDLEREAKSWVDQLLPAAGTLNPQAQAELAFVSAVIAEDTSDNSAVLAGRERLAPMLAGIQDAFLHAAAQLALAWALPIADDFDGALREASLALQEFRAQDEPHFTAMAAFTVGSLNTALGRYDHALRHLREASELADRSGDDWLAAGSRVGLGVLAALRGRLDEAQAELGEALDLSQAARSTPFVTLCLSGYARLAFAEGNLERAALLEGAAEGLRRRVGLSMWPHLRRVDAELVAKISEGLGESQYKQVTSAGSELTQREAVAIVRDQDRTRTEPP
jgi:predicted ATPase